MTQPPPLNYQSRGPGGGGPADNPSGQFFAGLVGGAVVSAITWFTGFRVDKNGSAILLLLVLIVGVKLGVGISLIQGQRRRMLGAGIISSIAVGALIFFGVCAANVSFH